MLQLRPSCEHCNKPLPPASTEAMICSFECTFCTACVNTLLDNVCPNCGGGFMPRPIRPARNLKGDNHLGRYPASTSATHRPVDLRAHAAFVRELSGIGAGEAQDAGTTRLVPMSEAAYGQWREAALADYAADNVAAGRWPAASALERSRKEFEELLPRGLATPDHFLFEILDAQTSVGVLWFAVVEQAGERHAYVYDVMVHPAQRRHGHALRAFALLEEEARALGLARIGLHVFGHNPGAQALYRRLGYVVTGLNMVKPLAPDATSQASAAT
jgi:ribosomal protein S18 acetylase RimI-like enzyme